MHKQLSSPPLAFAVPQSTDLGVPDAWLPPLGPLTPQPLDPRRGAPSPTPHGPPSPELDFTDDAKVEEYILKAFKAGAQQPASSAPSSVAEGEDSPGGAGPEKRAADSGSDSGGEPAARKRRRRGAGAEDPPEGAGECERASEKKYSAELRAQILIAGTEAIELNRTLRIKPPDGGSEIDQIDKLVKASRIARGRLWIGEDLLRKAGLWDRFQQAVRALEQPNRHG